MSFTILENAFQGHVANEACWNIPTALRMQLIGVINELTTSELDDNEKSQALYTIFQSTLEQQPHSELETAQLLSLDYFVKTHTRLDERAKRALLFDALNLDVARPVAA